MSKVKIESKQFKQIFIRQRNRLKLARLNAIIGKLNEEEKVNKKREI